MNSKLIQEYLIEIYTERKTGIVSIIFPRGEKKDLPFYRGTPLIPYRIDENGSVILPTVVYTCFERDPTELKFSFNKKTYKGEFGKVKFVDIYSLIFWATAGRAKYLSKYLNWSGKYLMIVNKKSEIIGKPPKVLEKILYNNQKSLEKIQKKLNISWDFYCLIFIL